MANSDKNIVITPNIGSSSDDPKIVFTGANTAGLYPITLRAYPTSSGTLSFEGSAGQLFSITNSLTGTLFSVNDVSGMPSIEVVDTGLVKLAQYSGNVVIGSSSDNTGKLQLQSNTWSNSTGTDFVIRNFNSVGAGMTLRPMNSSSFSAGWSVYAGASTAAIGDGALGFWNHTTQSHRFWVDQSANAYAITSFRAPIFYDTDNTAYYVDPTSSTSANFYGSVNAATYNLAGLLVNASGTASTGGSIAIQQVTAEGWTGIFCDFEPYTGWGLWHDNPNNYFSFTAEASTGGIRSFSVPSRVSGNRTAYEKFRVDQATGDTITGRDGYAQSSFRAPIFYDSNNTGYYLDPASTSNVNRLNLVGFDSSGRNYSREWIEFPNFSGLYSPNNGAHFYPNNQSSYGSWATQGSRNGWGGIQDTYSAVNGIMYDSAGNGGAYREASGRWYFYYSPSNDCMGIGTSSTSSTYSLYLTKGVYAQSRIDATIFYDTNNTGYYCDPNSNSRLNQVLADGGTFYGATYFQSNQNTTGSGPPLQAYSNNGSGAIMSFHRGGYYAVNMGLDNDNVIRIGGWSAAANRWQLDMSGNGTYAGNVTAYSDIRLKENIESIPNALEKVNAIRGVTFTRNDQEDKTKRHAGVIAQEVEKVLPEVISEDNEGIKNVAYGNMVGLLIEAIKEQQKQIEEMRSIIATK